MIKAEEIIMALTGLPLIPSASVTTLAATTGTENPFEQIMAARQQQIIDKILAAIQFARDNNIQMEVSIDTADGHVALILPAR